MIKLNITSLAALAMIAFASLPAGAQSVKTTELAGESRSGREVNVEADQMEVLEDRSKATFTGNVKAVRGDVRLSCAKLVVTYVSTKKTDGTSKTDVTFLDATGNVVIITSKQRITGRWAKMDVRANKLQVGGNVVVRQGQSVVRGPKLRVDMNTNKSYFSGGRVKGVFGTSK